MARAYRFIITTMAVSLAIVIYSSSAFATAISGAIGGGLSISGSNWTTTALTPDQFDKWNKNEMGISTDWSSNDINITVNKDNKVVGNKTYDQIILNGNINNIIKDWVDDAVEIYGLHSNEDGTLLQPGTAMVIQDEIYKKNGSSNFIGPLLEPPFSYLNGHAELFDVQPTITKYRYTTGYGVGYEPSYSVLRPVQFQFSADTSNVYYSVNRGGSGPWVGIQILDHSILNGSVLFANAVITNMSELDGNLTYYVENDGYLIENYPSNTGDYADVPTTTAIFNAINTAFVNGELEAELTTEPEPEPTPTPIPIPTMVPVPTTPPLPDITPAPEITPDPSGQYGPTIADTPYSDLQNTLNNINEQQQIDNTYSRAEHITLINWLNSFQSWLNDTLGIGIQLIGDDVIANQNSEHHLDEMPDIFLPPMVENNDQNDIIISNQEEQIGGINDLIDNTDSVEQSLNDLVDNTDTLKQGLNDIDLNIQDGIDILEDIRDWLNYIFDKLGVMQLSLESLLNAIKTAVQSIANTIEVAETALMDAIIDAIWTPLLPIFDKIKSGLGIWHYVVEWLRCISTPFTFFWQVLVGLGTCFPMPIYALAAATIVLAVYRRFGR